MPNNFGPLKIAFLQKLYLYEDQNVQDIECSKFKWTKTFAIVITVSPNSVSHTVDTIGLIVAKTVNYCHTIVQNEIQLSAILTL